VAALSAGLLERAPGVHRPSRPRQASWGLVCFSCRILSAYRDGGGVSSLSHSRDFLIPFCPLLSSRPRVNEDGAKTVVAHGGGCQVRWSTIDCTSGVFLGVRRNPCRLRAPCGDSCGCRRSFPEGASDVPLPHSLPRIGRNPRISPGNSGVVAAFLFEGVSWYTALLSARKRGGTSVEGVAVVSRLCFVDLLVSALVSLFFGLGCVVAIVNLFYHVVAILM
jgi:hypothetical protein